MCLLAIPLAGSKSVYRRTSVPLVEGWVFVAAAVVLSLVGALIDTVGT